ncbi:hypothetical protein OG735_06310 [Streptomyces sp. NBC_01210]|uniref:hypothetical protein n=1 Tax=Streptomyces sp. NBC_01210 TaxID=2903774 RepID=UPI002E159181|nr:hypothetical protein OG735_06310 [Streptomyces sp. NBC_01210]
MTGTPGSAPEDHAARLNARYCKAGPDLAPGAIRTGRGRITDDTSVATSAPATAPVNCDRRRRLPDKERLRALGY